MTALVFVFVPYSVPRYCLLRLPSMGSRRESSSSCGSALDVNYTTRKTRVTIKKRATGELSCQAGGGRQTQLLRPCGGKRHTKQRLHAP